MKHHDRLITLFAKLKAHYKIGFSDSHKRFIEKCIYNKNKKH